MNLEDNLRQGGVNPLDTPPGNTLWIHHWDRISYLHETQ